jgi:predicted DsbA family dithiol-disulfide isomerase
MSVLRFRQLSTRRFYVARDEVHERRDVRIGGEPASRLLELTARALRLPGLRPVPRGAEVMEPADELLPVAGDAEDVGEPARDDEVLTALEGALGVPEGGLHAGLAGWPLVAHAGDRTCRVPALRGRILRRVERIRFYFDVVCPYSYMESRVVEAAEDSGRLEVEWLPFELRPAPKPLLEVRGDHLRTDWTQTVYRRALAAGVEIHLPRFQPRSTLPMAACLWASDEGRLRELKHALYEAFFCEGLDIATDAEMARAAGIAGLDPVAAVTAAYDHANIQRLRSIRRDAEAAGVAGVPTLLTEDGRTHWGMGGVERLLADEPLVPRAAG